MSSMLRTLARNRAKENMKHLGFKRICSDPRHLGSYFADNWRNHTNAVKFVDKTSKKQRRA